MHYFFRVKIQFFIFHFVFNLAEKFNKTIHFLHMTHYLAANAIVICKKVNWFGGFIWFQYHNVCNWQHTHTTHTPSTLFTCTNAAWWWYGGFIFRVSCECMCAVDNKYHLTNNLWPKRYSILMYKILEQYVWRNS